MQYAPPVISPLHGAVMQHALSTISPPHGAVMQQSPQPSRYGAIILEPLKKRDG